MFQKAVIGEIRKVFSKTILHYKIKPKIKPCFQAQTFAYHPILACILRAWVEYEAPASQPIPASSVGIGASLVGSIYILVLHLVIIPI